MTVGIYFADGTVGAKKWSLVPERSDRTMSCCSGVSPSPTGK